MNIESLKAKIETDTRVQRDKRQLTRPQQHPLIQTDSRFQIISSSASFAPFSSRSPPASAASATRVRPHPRPRSRSALSPHLTPRLTSRVAFRRHVRQRRADATVPRSASSRVSSPLASPLASPVAPHSPVTDARSHIFASSGGEAQSRLQRGGGETHGEVLR